MAHEHERTRPAAATRTYYTTRALMALTGLSRNTINRAVSTGTLRVYGRPGGDRGERVFRREDIDRWLARGHEIATPKPDAPSQPAPRAAMAGDALARLDEIARRGRR